MRAAGHLSRCLALGILLLDAGTGWGTPELIETDNTNSARGARVAVDSIGGGVAVWTQHDGVRNNLMANRYTAGIGWGVAELVETSDAGPALEGECRVVIDRNLGATVVWTQRNVAGFTDDIWANTYNGSWGTAFVIDGAAGPAKTPQLAVDSGRRVVVVWSQRDAHQRSNIQSTANWNPG